LLQARAVCADEIAWSEHGQYSTIMVMTIPYERTGRTRQKARTRAALLAATRELLAEGVTPTVEQAADRAAISRTTAYRYFPNQRTLLTATYPQIEATSLLGAAPPADPAARLEAAAERFTQLLLENEPELRTHLRLSLESRPPQRNALPLRQGRGIAWFEDALAPLRERMSPSELRRLVLAVRAILGIEALMWLTDVGGLSREDAVEIMRSSARTLVRSAIAEAAPDR
jgi:AcrR family transcriptional regulator